MKQLSALMLLGCLATVACQYPVYVTPVQPLPQPVQSYYRIAPPVPQFAYVTPPPEARCVLHSATTPTVSGELVLYQNGDAVEIFGTVTGLAPGKHGFHMHEKGSTADGCKAAGPHFNPYNQTHGGPTDHIHHAGDFGNIWAEENGQANIHIVVKYISLSPGHDAYAVGRTMVVHAGEDDLGKGGNEESLKTGNAGGRLACCVVQ